MTVSATGVMENSVAVSGPSVPSTVGTAEDKKSLLMLMAETFAFITQIYSSNAQAINDKMEAKKNAMTNLTTLNNSIKTWNDSIGDDEAQIAKTNDILLAGVNIPQSAFSRCAFKKDKNDSLIYYSKFPPEVYGSSTQANQLVYVKEQNKYFFYGPDKKLREVYSPLDVKTLPGPDVDFSVEKPGTIVFNSSENKYYTVTADGAGIEMTDYPLQKFISSLSDKGAEDLGTAFSNRTATVQDLSKKDLLDAQEITAFMQTLSSAISGLIGSLTNVMNRSAGNI